MYSLADNCNARIALGIEYRGTAYHGWQKQASPSVPTIQGYLENAVARVANQDVKLFCAGRTDAGVHATAQVAHFDTAIDRGEKAWVMGVNSHLPKDIRVRWAKTVNDAFHARYSAIFRRYEYWIDNRKVGPGIFSGQITPYAFQLNESVMSAQAQALLGEQDFSSFRAASCQGGTPMRCVQAVSVARYGDKLCFTIQANAFLLHMVRNIVGALLEAGVGGQAENYIQSLLAQKDRTLAPPTAKPDGLYLVAVGYPDQVHSGSSIFI